MGLLSRRAGPHSTYVRRPFLGTDCRAMPATGRPPRANAGFLGVPGSPDSTRFFARTDQNHLPVIQFDGTFLTGKVGSTSAGPTSRPKKYRAECVSRDSGRCCSSRADPNTVVPAWTWTDSTDCVSPLPAFDSMSGGRPKRRLPRPSASGSRRHRHSTGSTSMRLIPGGRTGPTGGAFTDARK
jgi:hypothetical protein